MATTFKQNKRTGQPMMLAISLGAGILAAGLAHRWLVQQHPAYVIAPQAAMHRRPITQPEIPIHTGLAATLPPEYRAVTIAIDSISGVAGYAQPGDHVDVMATLDTTSGQATTRTVLQNILLLAIGSNNANKSDAAKQADPVSATLMVSPAQAQVVAIAGAHGHLQLSLCPAQVSPPAHLSAVSLTSLTSTSQPKPPTILLHTHIAHPVAHIHETHQDSPVRPLPPLISVPAIQPAPTVLVIHGTTVQAITVSH